MMISFATRPMLGFCLAGVIALVGCGGDDDREASLSNQASETTVEAGDTTTAPTTAPKSAPAELPDGEYFGFVTAADVDARTFTFNPVSGQPGAGEDESDTRYRVTYDQSLEVEASSGSSPESSRVFPRGLLSGLLPEAVEQSKTKYDGSGVAGYSLTVKDGKATFFKEWNDLTVSAEDGSGFSEPRGGTPPA